MEKYLFSGKRKNTDELVEGGIAYFGDRAFIISISAHYPDTRDWETMKFFEKNPQLISHITEVDPSTIKIVNADKAGVNNFLKDVLALQRQYANLCLSPEKKLNKSALCELVIPFRDKYKLNDLTALRLAKNAVSLAEIIGLMEKMA